MAITPCPGSCTCSMCETSMCRTCGADTAKMDLFPGGVCMSCWAITPAGRQTVTAQEIVAMWGG
jgi:hypothetical protein